ncbi:MAG TPA: thioredoxin domain-containing protein [candidate division Zixibacteria bacterium]|nr:thioredoxin domain-containing protein [candidate division Zixibacteria bacterium]
MPQQAKSKQAHTNKLIDENSPYLLSHAHNPVDWYPWGDEALNRARDEDKPIFLSIGYAACHWCHVMERESFEDEKVAAVLNENFVSIKVDREQRPDLDKIYMSFTTAMTGQGGWPMSVFLTPDLKPFFAGTYFPPVDGYGRPSFMKVITEIARVYRADKGSVIKSAEGVFDQIAARLRPQDDPGDIEPTILNKAAVSLSRNLDRINGGFGSEPKFPHALELSLFLQQYAHSGDTTYLEAALLSLDAMAAGGIYDQLGGGFARYSTDRVWLVPHFEKMLYDNALLVPLYTEAFQITGRALYREVVEQTLDWMLREMRSPEGVFYSALDADSEGEEGKFYIWDKGEIDSILGDDAERFNRYYNVTAGGNFEEKNILNVTAESRRALDDLFDEKKVAFLARTKSKLLVVRNERVRPLTDDKILTSWNGLALTALAKGFQVTGREEYLEAAKAVAEFVHSTLYNEGRLTHSYREERYSEGLFLEDYAYFARGLADLYESDPGLDNERWIDFATELSRNAVELFADDAGRWYLRPDGEADLIVRPQDEEDGSTPAPGSIMIGVLLKLARITGVASFEETARLSLRAVAAKVNGYPAGMVSAVTAYDFTMSDKIEIVVVGSSPTRDAMLRLVYGQYLPNRIVAISTDGRSSLPLFEGRVAPAGTTLAYVCCNSTCGVPATTAEELLEQLGEV